MAAADIAPRMGVRAALVERSRVGGDCLWTGCVPSKALIASARLAHRMRHAGDLGLDSVPTPVDTAPVMARVRHVQEAIAEDSDNAHRFESLGVTVLNGEARLVDGHRVVVDGRQVTARYILLATGSRPSVPPIEGLSDVGCLTSDTLFALERLPASMVIIGGGPIAIEMAQAMQRLGTRVTVLEALPGILAREEPSLGDRIQRTLEQEGAVVQAGVSLRRAHSDQGRKVLLGVVDGAERAWAADEILVAAGRAPNIEALALETAGVACTSKGVTIDDRLRTSVASVFAAGDVAGRFPFTHSAVSEAATALRNMFYPGSKAATTSVPWTTFTDPELGHAGMTSDEARRQFGVDDILVFSQSLADSDRARADGVCGEIVLVTDARYRLLGAHVLAPAAGDMMGFLADAIARGARLTPDFANAVQVYPTLAFSLSQAAGQPTYRQLDRPFLRAMRRLGALVH
ncbi:MAG: pyridine nucleotide-disulfide oxidoreductase [Dehalococcoidia bacterium]|nr:MAG: pyridine nucleotide-disulfide oxidoreductase [Dehalococcoidia bacterium]